MLVANLNDVEIFIGTLPVDQLHGKCRQLNYFIKKNYVPMKGTR